MATLAPNSRLTSGVDGRRGVTMCGDAAGVRDAQRAAIPTVPTVTAEGRRRQDKDWWDWYAKCPTTGAAVVPDAWHLEAVSLYTLVTMPWGLRSTLRVRLKPTLPASPVNLPPGKPMPSSPSAGPKSCIMTWGLGIGPTAKAAGMTQPKLHTRSCRADRIDNMTQPLNDGPSRSATRTNGTTEAEMCALPEARF